VRSRVAVQPCQHESTKLRFVGSHGMSSSDRSFRLHRPGAHGCGSAAHDLETCAAPERSAIDRGLIRRSIGPAEADPIGGSQVMARRSAWVVARTVRLRGQSELLRLLLAMVGLREPADGVLLIGAHPGSIVRSHHSVMFGLGPKISRRDCRGRRGRESRGCHRDGTHGERGKAAQFNQGDAKRVMVISSYRKAVFGNDRVATHALSRGVLLTNTQFLGFWLHLPHPLIRNSRARHNDLRISSI
jgi:hypothetical protein